MKDVRSSKVLFIFVLLATFVPVLQGATTLFTENWNSGSINSVVWKQLGNLTAINLENLGGGDYALCLARLSGYRVCTYRYLVGMTVFIVKPALRRGDGIITCAV